MIIYYDVTNLINRSKSCFPTGIDRIDLEYLNHFVESEQYEVYYIAEIRGQLLLIDEDLLLDYLDTLMGCWFQGLERGALLKFAFLGLTKANIFPLSLVNNIVRSNHKLNYSNLPKQGLYFNASNQGIAAGGQFNTFQTKTNCQVAAYIHDILPVQYPEFFVEGTKEQFEEYLQNIISQNDLILLTGSETVKSGLKEYSGNKNLTVHVIPPAPSQKVLEDKADDLILAKPYFIVLGTIEPRKNHTLLFKVWNRMTGVKPSLVVIGKRGWNEDVLDELDHYKKLIPSIKMLNNLNDHNVYRYLKHAEALLMPSHAEGYGLPLLEAMQNNIRIIASDIPVFREVLGKESAAQLLDPYDVAAWEEAIKNILREDLEEGIEYAREIRTWPEQMAKLDQILL